METIENLYNIKITYENETEVEFVSNSIQIQPSIISKGINIIIEEPEVNLGDRMPAVNVDLLDKSG